MNLLALGVAAAVAVLPVATPGSTPVGRVLFHLTDQRINESSGIAVATREPGVWFTHNDSGDSARFFALGPAGQTLATYDVDGATNVDWEDMAAAPRAGVPTLWFADIGDNNAPRPFVSVYAVPEPGVYPGLRGATVHVRSVRYRFRYPDGERDAETLLVDPVTARIYLASKSFDGNTRVYVAPQHPAVDRVNQLTALGSVQWTARPGSTFIELPAQLATTGGAFAPDGRSFVLRTYTDAYLFRIVGSGPSAVKAALAAVPQRLPLPKQPQGEGICFRRDGKALVLSSERIGSAVLEVVIPRVVSKPQAPPPAAAVPTSAPAPSRSGGSPAPTTSAAPVAAPVRAHHGSAKPALAGAIGLVVLLGLGFAVVRRKRGGPAR